MRAKKMPDIEARDPVSGRKLGYLVPACHIGVNPEGEVCELDGATLPQGWRLPTEEEVAWCHGMRCGSVVPLPAIEGDPYAEKRERQGEKLDARGKRIPKSPADRARDRKPGRKGVVW